eukprot:gene4370-4417_t
MGHALIHGIRPANPSLHLFLLRRGADRAMGPNDTGPDRESFRHGGSLAKTNGMNSMPHPLRRRLPSPPG